MSFYLFLLKSFLQRLSDRFNVTFKYYAEERKCHLCFLSASSCASEMERWVEDIRMAIDLAEHSSSPGTDLLSTSLSDNSKSTLCWTDLCIS